MNEGKREDGMPVGCSGEPKISGGQAAPQEAALGEAQGDHKTPVSQRRASELRLEESWKVALQNEFERPYMKNLKAFLVEQKRQSKVIFPRGEEFFAALNLTPLDKVRVVILGQDPYHGPEQAHGLCFSVRKGVPLPPSLQNIFKELSSDLGIHVPSHGSLAAWARQGVLLLNAVLTVEQGRAGSHRGQGWEEFTDRIIKRLNRQERRIIFLLWGADAQKKGRLIDRGRHVVLSAPHPSPLSAHRGFFGCRHFSKVNLLLQRWGESEIDWRIPEE